MNNKRAKSHYEIYVKTSPQNINTKNNINNTDVSVSAYLKFWSILCKALVLLILSDAIFC